MKLDCIVTLANQKVRLRFLAMERSLRATGCDLPLRVIPYSADCFPLPANAELWEQPEIITWTGARRTHPTMRKYQCLTIGSYQFVDADVIFLRDPARALLPHDGFVTSCGHWHNPGNTQTPESTRWLSERSTIWQQNVFNSGQFACDRALFSPPDLIACAEQAEFSSTTVTFRFHEQPGLNLLVASSGVAVNNLTLPPTRMQSTWAGDYPDADFRRYWRTESETPYLIHWAGCRMDRPRAINEIFYEFLSKEERAEWDRQVAMTRATRRRFSLRRSVGRLRRAVKAMIQTLTSG